MQRKCSSFIQGTPLDSELGDSIEKYTEKYTVVCFLRTYDYEFQGQTQKRNSAVKVYTLQELQQASAALAYPEASALLEHTDTRTAKDEKSKFRDQFFTPTTKLVLEGIAAAGSSSSKMSPSANGTKRALSFTEENPANEPTPPEAAPTEITESSADQALGDASIELMPADPTLKPSPSKKHKDD